METESESAMLYSIGETAQALHCSTMTVRRLVKMGQLKGLSLGGTSGAITRVTVASIRDFIKRAEVLQL